MLYLKLNQQGFNLYTELEIINIVMKFSATKIFCLRWVLIVRISS